MLCRLGVVIVSEIYPKRHFFFVPDRCTLISCVPLSRLAGEGGNLWLGEPPFAPTPLSHPVGEGLGVRARKREHLVCIYKAAVCVYGNIVCVYEAIVYIYETAVCAYEVIRCAYENTVYAYEVIVCAYENTVCAYEVIGYAYGAAVEFLAAGGSIHGICAG